MNLVETSTNSYDVADEQKEILNAKKDIEERCLFACGVHKPANLVLVVQGAKMDLGNFDSVMVAAGL